MSSLNIFDPFMGHNTSVLQKRHNLKQWKSKQRRNTNNYSSMNA